MRATVSPAVRLCDLREKIELAIVRKKLTLASS